MTTDWFIRRLWLWLFLALALLEFWTLRTPGRRDTLSETVWDLIRWTEWRLLAIPLWTWLTWHWFLRREQTLDWRDLVAVAAGALWAGAELVLARR